MPSDVKLQRYLVCLRKKECTGTKASMTSVKVSFNESKALAAAQDSRCFICGRQRELDDLSPVEFR